MTYVDPKIGICVFFISTECLLSPQGHEYLGHQSVTISNRTCQVWRAQVPHTHTFSKSSNYPDNTLRDAANYCRDPDSDVHVGGPWCYTTDPDVRWEYCSIPLCTKPTAEPLTTTSPSQGECLTGVFYSVYSCLR